MDALPLLGKFVCYVFFLFFFFFSFLLLKKKNHPMCTVAQMKKKFACNGVVCPIELLFSDSRSDVRVM